MVFTVVGIPQPKGSTRGALDRRGRLRIFNDNPKTTNWQRAVAWAARCAGAQPLAGPVRVDVVFSMPRGATRKTQEAHPVGAPCLTIPDVDKLLRAVLDGLIKQSFADDSQVVELRGRKVYGNEPGATITVESL